MRKLLTAVLALLCLSLLRPGELYCQPIPSKYHSYDEMTRAIKNLATTHSDIVKTESLGKTIKGRDIWLIMLRKGDPAQPRAMLVVGGTEALQLAGSEMVLRLAEHLANGFGKVDSITKLLQSTTIYIIPRVSPDAMEAYFERPLHERTTNYKPIDDDHDGAIDEDDVDDVNRDGVITMMRVKDPRGEWIAHPEDARLMKKADPAKGERGEYLLHTEGVDNDKDEQWNEDAVGGIDFNSNFPFNYKYFSQNAGIHQVSEKETRAIADFIFSRPNIALVFSFSSIDNLTTPWKTEPRRSTPTAETAAPSVSPFSRSMDPAARVVTSVLEEDQPYFEYISRQFLEITKAKDAPEPKKGVGAFTDWVYYHAGRWSFSVRPWWAPDRGTRRDTAAGEGARRTRTPMPRTPQRDSQEARQDESSDQLRALRWYDANGYKDIAVPWTKVKHPDFPDREVEIGGPRPYVLWNPPAESLNAFSQPYATFLTYLAGQLPSLSLGNTKVEKVNDGVYRLTVDVVDNGYLPTNSTLGVRVRWPRNVYLTLKLDKDQSLASGKAKQRMDPIGGNGGFQTVSWLVVARAGSSVTVTAESPMAGTATSTITLR